MAEQTKDPILLANPLLPQIKVLIALYSYEVTLPL